MYLSIYIHILTNIQQLWVLNNFQEVTQKFWGTAVVRRGTITTVIKSHKKQLGICIEYSYISELMLWLYRGKFVNIKLVKIPSLATSKYREQWGNRYESLKGRTYLGKKNVFNFLDGDFLEPKSGHRREKQPVLELDFLSLTWFRMGLFCPAQGWRRKVQ